MLADRLIRISEVRHRAPAPNPTPPQKPLMPSGKRQSIGRYHSPPKAGDEPRRGKLRHSLPLRIQPVAVVHQLEVKGTATTVIGTEIEPHLKIVRPQGLSSSSNTRPSPAAHAPGDSRLADSRPWPPARSHRAPPWPDRTTVLAGWTTHPSAPRAGSICCLRTSRTPGRRAGLALLALRPPGCVFRFTDTRRSCMRSTMASACNSPRIRNSLARSEIGRGHAFEFRRDQDVV